MKNAVWDRLSKNSCEEEGAQSSFYQNPGPGTLLLRLGWCKRSPTSCVITPIQNSDSENACLQFYSIWQNTFSMQYWGRFAIFRKPSHTRSNVTICDKWPLIRDISFRLSVLSMSIQEEFCSWLQSRPRWQNTEKILLALDFVVPCSTAPPCRNVSNSKISGSAIKTLSALNCYTALLWPLTIPSSKPGLACIRSRLAICAALQDAKWECRSSEEDQPGNQGTWAG